MRLSYRKMKGGVVSEQGQRFWENIFFFKSPEKLYLTFFPDFPDFPDYQFSHRKNDSVSPEFRL